MKFRRGASLWGTALALGLTWGCNPDSPSRPPTKVVRFVGFDESEPLVAALEDGRIQGLVLQDPYRMGQEVVRTLVDALEKRKVEARISTGEMMATPENWRQAEIARLLNPPKVKPKSVGGGGAKSKKWRVMVIPKGLTHEHWQAVNAGALKAAEELGTVEVIWLGPEKESDRTQQIQFVQTAIGTGVDGIALAPLDSKALVAPVEAAISKGIAVVIFDSALESDKPVSYIATDNYRGGVLAGERLADLLKQKGRIILLRYAENSASTQEREKGFEDTIKKYPGITYLSNNRHAGATADTAQKEAQNLVSLYRDQVDGVFCPNESSTFGMLRALEDAGMVKAQPNR